MRVKKYPSVSELRKLKTKKLIVKIKRLKKQDEKLHLNNFEECDNVSVFEHLEATKSENKDQSTHNSSIFSDKKIIKPFNTVLRLGDMSFISNDPFLKLSKKENVSKTPEKFGRGYRRKLSKDVYEFTSQSEEDCDPTADVVKKIIKEGRARLVKRKPGKPMCNRKPRNKSTSEYLRSLERYRRKNYTKILMERKSNCPGVWDQKFWNSLPPVQNASSTEDSKHERGLGIDEFRVPRSPVVIDLNDNVQNLAEEVDSSKTKKNEHFQKTTPGNIQILEVLILPNKTIRNPTATLEDEKSEEELNSNVAMEEHSEEIVNTVDTPEDRDSEIVLNRDDYLLNDEPDYVNFSCTYEPSLTEMSIDSVDVNSTAETPAPGPINTSICGNHKPSTHMDSCFEEADIESHKPKPLPQTDSSIEARPAVKPPEPKPTRKAFWEIEDPEEETLDKSLIKNTYSRPKPKERRTHFFILFSDDEDSKKSIKSTKENSSPYYTRSKIQNWIESTKLQSEKNDNLVAKKSTKANKSILKTQNKISDKTVNLKPQQKENRKKNVIIEKVKDKKCISSSSRIGGRGLRQHSLRL